VTIAVRGLGIGDYCYAANDLRWMAIRGRNIVPMSSGTIRAVLPLRRVDLLTETHTRLEAEGGDLGGPDTLDAEGGLPGVVTAKIVGASPRRGQAGNVS
jgi:hypothetical protein